MRKGGRPRSSRHRNWYLRESIKEADIEVILERVKEKHPEAKPSIISDNGPLLIARVFKEPAQCEFSLIFSPASRGAFFISPNQAEFL